MRFSDFLKLFAWEVVNPTLLRAKRRRVYDFNGDLRGINLGCGLASPPGWLGVDGGITHIFAHRAPKSMLKVFFRQFRMAKNFTVEDYSGRIKSMRMVHHDLRYGLPFRDGSIPNVYSSHFFEHLTRADGRRLMNECFRVLRPGGLIRICVPSLDSEAAKVRQALAAYDAGDIEAIQRWVADDRNGFLGPYSCHRWMYNVKDLSDALRAAGFDDIVERTYREGAIADVEQLDTRSGIYVEARRP